MRLNNVRVQPYNLADPPSRLDRKTFYLRGAGHSLRDVTTAVMTGYSGADIQDDTSDIHLGERSNGRRRRQA